MTIDDANTDATSSKIGESRITKQGNFSYSPRVKAFEKQTKNDLIKN